MVAVAGPLSLAPTMPCSVALSPRKPPKRKPSDLSFPIESKRPKSATMLLAYKHVGTRSRDALVQREPEDAHTLPSDVLCMRKEHQERRVQYLVELARRGEWTIEFYVMCGAGYPCDDGDVNAATQGTASKASANVVRARVTGGGKGTGSLADRIPEGESSWYI